MKTANNRPVFSRFAPSDFGDVARSMATQVSAQAKK